MRKPILNEGPADATDPVCGMKVSPESELGDFRHCMASCRLARRLGPVLGAEAIVAWNLVYEDDTPESRDDVAANWCGYRQAFKFTCSCEHLCRCHCVVRE